MKGVHEGDTEKGIFHFSPGIDEEGRETVHFIILALSSLLENLSLFSKLPSSVRKLSHFRVRICPNQLLDPGQVS